MSDRTKVPSLTGRFADYAGKVFGELLVYADLGKTRTQGALWRVICRRCDAIVEMKGSDVVSGRRTCCKACTKQDAIAKQRLTWQLKLAAPAPADESTPAPGSVPEPAPEPVLAPTPAAPSPAPRYKPVWCDIPETLPVGTILWVLLESGPIKADRSTCIPKPGTMAHAYNWLQARRLELEAKYGTPFVMLDYKVTRP